MLKGIIGFFTGKLWWLKVIGSLIGLLLIYWLLMFLWGVVAFANPEVKDLELAFDSAQADNVALMKADSILRAQKDSCEALRFTMEGNYQLQVIKLTQAAKKYKERAVYAEKENAAFKENGSCKYPTEIKVGNWPNRRKAIVYTAVPCKGDTVWVE